MDFVQGRALPFDCTDLSVCELAHKNLIVSAGAAGS